MRISPISVLNVKNCQKHNLKTQTAQDPNFKGWGGVLGTVGGAILGAGLTAISGGALLWTVPAISGITGIGGDIYEKSRK